MGVSKIVLNGVTQMDITDTTAVASDVAQGKYFYGSDGEKIEGVATGFGAVTQDEDGYIVLPTTGGGSGGSPITLLDTITVTEQVRAVNIDITPYSSYDMIVICADITLTASDWLYVVKNGSSPSGGSFSEKLSTLKGLLYVRGTTACGRAGWTDAVTFYSGMSSGNSTVTNLYAYTYDASKAITAGSKFYIYGGTYADILQ